MDFKTLKGNTNNDEWSLLRLKYSIIHDLTLTFKTLPLRLSFPPNTFRSFVKKSEKKKSKAQRNFQKNVLKGCNVNKENV